MNEINVNGKSLEEERSFLRGIQDDIQKSIDEKNETLAAMKQDIVEHRR